MCGLTESEKISEEEEGDVGLSLNLIVKRSRERSRKG